MTTTLESAGEPSAPEAADQWISLTDLGRSLGISAVSCGRLLIQAGLRQLDGRPTERALQRGLARSGGQALQRGRATLWQQAGCAAALGGNSPRPVQQPTLVEQWAELLWALKQGSPSIATSAEQMAEDLPHELVGAVNRQLQDKGWDFQVSHHPSRPQPSAQHHGQMSSGRSRVHRSSH
ncbi:hypothetical protein KQ304_11465 [Synechococcus sp. CS-1329]|uniref:hypothetical protein n=1 Tax=Synechococcus sp. CS-1329 TaxID=2847975 RepID=UPI00223C0E4C|nr:hypothetical protein [Synechococcus sp. CS-1329]MCT0219604.1 hypothetical protein [Synechococcus sp. CS-1329]